MAERWILQFCYSHYGPSPTLRASMRRCSAGSPYKVLTVYLTGEPSEAVRQVSASDEVIFLDFSSKAVGGLKLAAIRALRKIAASRDFALVIAHRAKPTYIACLATKLPVISVHHAFGDYGRRTPLVRQRFRKRLSLLAVSDAVRDDIHPPSAPVAGGKDRDAAQPPRRRCCTVGNRATQGGARRSACRRVPVIGNVGRLHPGQGSGDADQGFAAALPRLPTGTLLAIAGSGRWQRH